MAMAKLSGDQGSIATSPRAVASSILRLRTSRISGVGSAPEEAVASEPSRAMAP